MNFNYFYKNFICKMKAIKDKKDLIRHFEQIQESDLKIERLKEEIDFIFTQIEEDKNLHYLFKNKEHRPFDICLNILNEFQNILRYVEATCYNNSNSFFIIRKNNEKFNISNKKVFDILNQILNIEAIKLIENFERKYNIINDKKDLEILENLKNMSNEEKIEFINKNKNVNPKIFFFDENFILDNLKQILN